MTENEAIKILKRDLAIQIENKALPDGIKAIETAIQALSEIQQYRAIGTVEEFKALKEKSVAKKPYIQQIVKDFREHDCYECPNCDCFVGYVSECQEEHYQYIYCPNCGQKLDWQ